MQYAYILHGGMAGTMTEFYYEPPIDELLQVRIGRDKATDEELATIPADQALVVKQSFRIGRVPAVFGFLSRYTAS